MQNQDHQRNQDKIGFSGQIIRPILKPPAIFRPAGQHLAILDKPSFNLTKGSDFSKINKLGVERILSFGKTTPILTFKSH